MYLARVTGRVVCTVTAEGLTGVPLQWIQPLGEDGQPSGEQLVACAAIDSGPGDLVHFVDGREAALALATTFVPVDASITGYVSQAISVDRDLAENDNLAATDNLAENDDLTGEG